MFDIEALVKTVSYFGLFGIIFAETGLLIGFFLPGDSLLITAGILAAQGFVKLPLVLLICTLAPLLGDSLGYYLGRRFGPLIFSRPENRFLDPKHIDRANHYFAKYGARTFVLARFIPIVRTIVPTLAGVSRIPYKTFIGYSVAASVIWGTGLPLLGFFLGKAIGPESLEHFLYVIIGLVVVASFIPLGLEYLRYRRAQPIPVKAPASDD